MSIPTHFTISPILFGFSFDTISKQEMTHRSILTAGKLSSAKPFIPKSSSTCSLAFSDPFPFTLGTELMLAA